MKIKITTEIELTIEEGAKWFAHLDDDAQARFFVEVDKEADRSFNGGTFGKDFQWQQIGSHLKNCSCSTDGARELIENIHFGMQHGTH